MTHSGNILTRIYQDLLDALDNPQHSDLGNDNLLQGSWGALLYLFYYEMYVDGTADQAASWLVKLYDRIELHEEAGFSYSIGLSGPLWLLQHLNSREIVEMDLGEMAEGFIEGAILRSKMDMYQDNFDFLGGSAGICYVLTSFTHQEAVRQHLQAFAENLERKAVAAAGGLSLPVSHLHTGTYTAKGEELLGLSHGSCALRMILCRIHEAGIAPYICSRLIYENIRFVMSCRNPDTAASLYPRVAGATGNTSSLSWCYGDMGVAVSLWYCGHYFKEDAWMQEALDIMHHNLKRRTPEDTGIKDACLCHGAAGAAVIYHKFWKETGDEAFRDAAIYWYDQTLQTATFRENAGEHSGTKVWDGHTQSWQYSCNILDGSAGVGLALLSQHVDEPLPWMELLLIL